MSKILPYLYIGDIDDVTNHNWLHSEGITHIVNCAKELDTGNICESFSYLKLSFDDAPDEKLFPRVKKGHDFIRKAMNGKGKVLVHCYAGISRSVSTACFHLMHEYGISFDEALRVIKKSRRIANPNSGFKKQLKSLVPRKRR